MIIYIMYNFNLGMAGKSLTTTVTHMPKEETQTSA